MSKFKLKMFLNKNFSIIVVTSLIAQVIGSNAAGENNLNKYFIGHSFNRETHPKKDSIVLTENTSNVGNPSPFLATVDETKDHSERAKIDLFFKDISRRVNPLYAKKNGFSVNYATQFHDSKKKKSRSEEYLKPDANTRNAIRSGNGKDHEGALDLGITFQKSISQSLVRGRGNMAQVDLRNSDIDRQKDKLAHDAATFTLIPTQGISPSRDFPVSSKFQLELTHVSVENEKGSQGSRMKDHKTQKNHLDTPWTRTKGFPLRLLHFSPSIGTRLTRDENFKQVSNNPLLPVSYNTISSYQRSGSPSTSSTTLLQTQGKHMNVASEKDSQDIEHSSNRDERYQFFYRHPISKKTPIFFIPPDNLKKEIHRMKRNAAGDQFTKNLSSNLRFSTEDDAGDFVERVHSRERSSGEMKEDAPVHSPSTAQALERLKLLVGKIVQELSQFKQKFTLRLIRMTEKDDLTQLPEIMKDFQISPERPIFLIAGGLKVLPVVPTPILTTTSESEEASTSETVFTATSTLGTTTSSEFLRDTILENESSIAPSHATDSNATTFTPEVETTTTQEPSSTSSSYLSFPQVLTAWFSGVGMKSVESTSTTSEKDFAESHNEFHGIESSSEMPENSSTISATDHFEIDSSTTNPFLPTTTTFTAISLTSPVDSFTSELITKDEFDSAVTESFFDSGLTDKDKRDAEDQNGKKLSRKKRSKTSVVDMDEITFYLSPPERMARTENPFEEDNEPGVYYPVLPSYYELTPWPYVHVHHDVIRQSQNVRDDDSSDLTDVDEGLLLLPNLMLSSPTPLQPNNKDDEESTGSSEVYSLSGDSQRESRKFNDQREMGINLHNINLTLPSPGDSSALSRVHQTLLPSTVEGLNTLANVHNNGSQVYEQVGIDKNDNENITPLLSKNKEPSLKTIPYNIEAQSKQEDQVLFSSNSRTPTAASAAYSKVFRSGSTRDTSEEKVVPSSGNVYNASSKSDDAKQDETFQDAFTYGRNSSSDKIKTSLSMNVDKPSNLEVVPKTIDSQLKVSQPSNQLPWPTSTSGEAREANNSDTIQPTTKLILNLNLENPLKSRNSSTGSLNGTTTFSRTYIKAEDFKEMKSGNESIQGFQTKVVRPIILSTSSSVAMAKATKPISSTPTDTVGVLKEKEKNSDSQVIKSSNTKVKVNMPEKVLEKVNARYPVAPDPEITIESPHHITIIASGTVINSEKMRNMSDPGIPVDGKSHDPPTQEMKDKGTSNGTNNNHSGDNTNSTKEASPTSTIKATTEKPLEINVKISSPIIDAATSIIQSIFGFGTVPAASNTKGNGSVTTTSLTSLNDTKTETVSVDRKKENNSGNSETQSFASSNGSGSSNTSELNALNSTSTSTTGAATGVESQSFLGKVSKESVSNLLSSKNVISSHESSIETGSRLQNYPTLPKLDDNHNSHSSGDPPKVTLMNSLTSAELFNEQQNNNATSKNSFVVNTSKKKNEPPSSPTVAVAVNFDKDNPSHISSQLYLNSPISNSTGSSGSSESTIGSMSNETPNANHVFTSDQNGNQTHVEEPSASTYSSGQPEHTNVVSNKVVEPFDPSTLSLNLDLLGTFPTTSSGIVSLSSPILPSQGSHVLYSPLASKNNNNPSVPIRPFISTYHNQQQQHTPSQPHLFPIYQSNRLSPLIHSNLQQQPSYYPWNPMLPPMFAYLQPQMPLAPDHTDNSNSNSAQPPVVQLQENVSQKESTDATSTNSFKPGTDASHEKESHKRQEYLMHLYFPNI